MAAAIICAKATEDRHGVKYRGLPAARWRQAQSRFARGLGESPSVAQLVRLLQTLNLGFTRRQVAWRLREEPRSAAGNILPQLDVTTKNSKRREFS